MKPGRQSKIFRWKKPKLNERSADLMVDLEPAHEAQATEMR